MSSLFFLVTSTARHILSKGHSFFLPVDCMMAVRKDWGLKKPDSQTAAGMEKSDVQVSSSYKYSICMCDSFHLWVIYKTHFLMQLNFTVFLLKSLCFVITKITHGLPGPMWKCNCPLNQITGCATNCNQVFVITGNKSFTPIVKGGFNSSTIHGSNNYGRSSRSWSSCRPSYYQHHAWLFIQCSFYELLWSFYTRCNKTHTFQKVSPQNICPKALGIIRRFFVCETSLCVLFCQQWLLP